MCGIAGYCFLASEVDAHPNLQNMTRLLVHRGPDDEGHYQDAHVGLGICRLSIIDLETGHQPMANEDGTVWVVFNGEIYNYRDLRNVLEARAHRFVTRSDTEVLVHGYEEWGEDLPKHLRGMFAFAIYDRRPLADMHSDGGSGGLRSTFCGRLFLARDHFGTKPLYYAQVNGTLLFASEVKSLLAYPGFSREVDLEALDQYLSFLYVPEPRTIFRGIWALPPAHSMICQDGQVTIRRYWKFQPQPENYASREQAIEQVRESFEESVKAMLVADVPLGLFLSGGVDSASILAMMVRNVDEPIRTFSIGFGAREKHWDELDAARRIATFFKTEHHEFRLKQDVVKLLPRIVGHFDQPFANPTAIILYLLSAETRHYVKVALAGTGGDEMFAGYPRYLGMLLYQKYRHLPLSLRQCAAALARRLAHDGTDGRLGPQRIRRFLEGGAMSFEACYIWLLQALDDARKQNLYTPELNGALQNTDTEDFIRPYLTDGCDLRETERLMLADIHTYLPYNQLAYGDRMSMAQSLEVRVPFVDQQIIQVAGGIPLCWKMPRGVTKGLFRKSMKPFLPQEVVHAPKQGLNLPIALWFRKDLRGWVRSLLSPQRLLQRGYFQPEAVTSVIAEHECGRRDHSLFLWALVVLEIWHQLYIDQQDGVVLKPISEAEQICGNTPVSLNGS